MQIRDRIKEFRRVKARDLYASPRNWRIHPKSQQDALRGILAEIGYADALLARELPDGKLELVDGHLRAETTPDQEVPVLILDLDEDEANKLLTLLDPLAAMAESNAKALESLLSEINTDSEALQSMLNGLSRANGIFERGENDPIKEWQAMPEFENEPKGIGQVIVHFRNEDDMQAFSNVIGQTIKKTTKFIWFPHES